MRYAETEWMISNSCSTFALTRTTLLSAVFNESAWTIYRAGVNALCLSSGETESAADETAATEPNAIEIAETYRFKLVASSSR
jgi:hypothetical protein